jgi:dienelactone hydrolase
LARHDSDSNRRGTEPVLGTGNDALIRIDSTEGWEPMRDPERRLVLTASATGLLALLTGCQSGGPRTTSPTPTETDAASTTTRTEGETTTTTESGADPAELKRRSREFVALIDEESYERAHERFNPTAAGQISQDQLEQVWTSLEERHGEFRTLSGLETASQGGYDVVTGIAEFERGQLEIVLAFDPDGIARFTLSQPSSNWSPPAYADESAFEEREVSLEATDSCSLGGTLTVPADADRAPGVVLIHGQGPSDRDGTIGPNKPYKDLAWGLASRGVAVLRYDKRTQVCDVDLAEITIDQAVTEDALAVVDALRETDVVADDDVVVAGHSIGATLSPRIAARDGNLAGVVMLAPLARSAGDAILDQNQYLVERDGTVTDAERGQLDEVNRTVERIRSLDFPDDEVVFLGGDEYWRSLREYDHLGTAGSLDAPVLLLQGERDYQVTVEDDFAQWQEALGDESNVTFERYPELNHLFMPGTGKPGRREYFEQHNVAEAVVTDVASFVADATEVEIAGE